MILIAGAKGQVGSAAIDALVVAGAEVRALARHHPGPPGLKVFRSARAASTTTERSPERWRRSRDAAGRQGWPRLSFPASARARAGPSRRTAAHRQAVVIGDFAGVDGSVNARHHEVDEESGKVRQAGRPSSQTSITRICCAPPMRSDTKDGSPSDGPRPLPLVDTRDVGAAAAVVSAIPPHTGRHTRRPAPCGQLRRGRGCARHCRGDAVAYEPVARRFPSRQLAAGVPDWRAFDLATLLPPTAPKRKPSPRSSYAARPKAQVALPVPRRSPQHLPPPNRASVSQ